MSTIRERCEYMFGASDIPEAVALRDDAIAFAEQEAARARRAAFEEVLVLWMKPLQGGGMVPGFVSWLCQQRDACQPALAPKEQSPELAEAIAAKSQCQSSDAELVARAATEYPSLAKVDFSASECAAMVAEIDRLRAENARLRNVINALPCINESANEDCQQQGLPPEDTCEVCRLQWTIDGSTPAAPSQEPADRVTRVFAERCASVSQQGLCCQQPKGHSGDHCAIRESGVAFSDDRAAQRPDKEGK